MSRSWRDLVQLPVELATLLDEWEFLELRIQPGRSSELGLRRGSGDPVLSEVERDSLRRFRETKRKEIGRMAEAIRRRTHEIITCHTCKAENDWGSASCEHCGAPLRNTVRTRTRDGDA